MPWWHRCRSQTAPVFFYSVFTVMKNRLFAVGDIHGCYASFEKLIETKIKPRKTDKIILLGDLIDRGPQSKEVVDLIIDLQRKGFDIIPLLGNHEDMMLNALDN